MAKFPEVDPATLAQAIKTYVAARMNVPALQNGSAANYASVVYGWAEAITSIQNPTNLAFKENDDLLFAITQQSGGNGQGTLLFSTQSPLQVGQWVYLASSDTVAAADFNLAAKGPAIGVVTEVPSQDSALVQNIGSFVYPLQGFGFIPFTPDTVYYIGAAGSLVTTPSAPIGGYVQEVGYSKNTVQLVLNIQDPTLV